MNKQMIVILFSIGMFFPLTSQSEQNLITPTRFFMDFYGQIEGAQLGDELTVRDENNILCGQFTINKAGQYGFIHVYGDDPESSQDEGANQGDHLIFSLNGTQIFSVSNQMIWLGDKQNQRLDFIVK